MADYFGTLTRHALTANNNLPVAFDDGVNHTIAMDFLQQLPTGLVAQCSDASHCSSSGFGKQVTPEWCTLDLPCANDAFSPLPSPPKVADG